MEILVFGNPLLKEDNIALKLMKEMQKKFPHINFIEFDSTEDLQNKGRDLKIIDSIKGIDEVKLISFPPQSLNILETNKIFSMHDFDLAHNLKLLEKMKMIDKIEILCIPHNMPEKEASAQSQLILRKWVAQLMQGS